jgi:methionyl aminopeptidase
MMIHIKSVEEIEFMRRPNEVVAEVLEKIEEKVVSGVSTYELDSFAEQIIKNRGARPAFKGYRGYPATLCTSINEVVVHGIPSKTVILEEGDIIGIDVGAEVDGWFGDAAKTFPVGKISGKNRKLIKITKESLEKAIKILNADARISDIGHAIQSHAEKNGFSVVRDYTGHGIGREMHESPQVLNFGKPGHGPLLKPGIVLAIEPMLNMGTWETEVLDDGWTVVTADKKNSAHFEHTVALTDDGPKILSVY